MRSRTSGSGIRTRRYDSPVFGSRVDSKRQLHPSEPRLQEFYEQLVDDASALGEDALEGPSPGVAEDDSIDADAQPAIAVQGPLQRLDVTPLLSQIAEGSSQASPRIRGKPSYKIDDLLGELDLHCSSIAERGKKRVFPAR